MYHRYLQFFTLELLLRCLHFFCYRGRCSPQLGIRSFDYAAGSRYTASRHSTTSGFAEDEGYGRVARSLQMRGGWIAHQRIQYKPMIVQIGMKRKRASPATAPKRLTANKFINQGTANIRSISKVVKPLPIFLQR